MAGVIAVLWNLVGVFDYLATQLKIESYMGNFTPEQLDHRGFARLIAVPGGPAWRRGALRSS